MSGMKFDMGSTTLGTLSKGTQGSHDDLGSLVKELVRAVEPLEGKFNGRGRVAFDSFKQRTDEVAAELNSSLAKILEGQGEMDLAFHTGDEEAGQNASQSEGKSSFDRARFSGQA
ncbi:hypothetical protein GCM10027055_28120 [Janibacter alkaliphilus]